MAPRRRSIKKQTTFEPLAVASPRVYDVSAPPLHPPPVSGRRNPPKRSKSRLQMHMTAAPLYRDSVHVVRGFLKPEECAAWIRWAEAFGFTEARHAASSEIAFRDNGRVEVWEPNVAAGIWERLREMVPTEVDGWQACGCYEKIRVYRYRAGGQRFGKHVDESSPGSVEGTKTAITVLIYLNGGEAEDELEAFGAHDSVELLRGGETVSDAWFFFHCFLFLAFWTRGKRAIRLTVQPICVFLGVLSRSRWEQ